MTEVLAKFLVILQCWCLFKVVVHACDPPCLYFSAGNTIKSIELSSAQVTSHTTVSQAGRAIAVTIDVEDKLLYWSDKQNRSIKRIDLQSGKIDSVINEVGDPEGISVEWVNKYIYWTEKENNRIEMSRVDGSDRKLLFDSDVETPRGITVDPVHGYIFWTDYGQTTPKIERATLAGQERTTIIVRSSTYKLTYPNDIIVDHKESKIYWVDAGLDVVGKADLDGRNIQLSEAIRNSHLFGLALHKKTLYLSDMETNAKSIRLMDKDSLKTFREYTYSVIGSRDLMGITVMQSSRQPPVNSSCSNGNGRCNHFCFIVPGGYRCGCPDGTALRKDGYSCQEANFTNCRKHPCQNGGTCYFDFAKLSDECTCKKYYEGKDCGIYLGKGAVRITLEMKVKELDEEKFKQAIVKGLHDYCVRDKCRIRNKTIAKQFCPSFLNNSAFNVTQVTIIGQPTQSSVPSHTLVDFALILRAETSSKTKVVLNTTLEHVVQESAISISKHLGGNQKVYVNNPRPPADAECLENAYDGNNKTDVKNAAEGNTKGKSHAAIIIGITISVLAVAIVLVVVAVRYRCIGQKDNNEEGNDDEQHFQNDVNENGGDRRDRPGSAQGYQINHVLASSNQNVSLNRENFNNREVLGGPVEDCNIQQQENCGGYLNRVCSRETDIQQPVGNYEDMNSPQTLLIPHPARESWSRAESQPRNNRDQQGCEGYANQDFVGEAESQQLREDYEDMNLPQASSIPQLTLGDLLGRRNVSENRPSADNTGQQDCDVYENEVPQETDSQQSEALYEEIDAPQAPLVPAGVKPAPSLPATRHNANKGDASSNHDNQICPLTDGPETERQAVEHDESCDSSSTYATAVQCTDDLQEKQKTAIHKPL